MIISYNTAFVELTNEILGTTNEEEAVVHVDEECVEKVEDYLLKWRYDCTQAGYHMRQ